MISSARRRRFSTSTIRSVMRDRPELADRQRLHVLVGAHEAAQHLGVEVAVGVGDEGPGEAEHARIAGERTVGQLRQLPIVAGRQIGADFANLPFDEVIVVDQPLGGRRDARGAHRSLWRSRGRRRSRTAPLSASRPASGWPLVGFGVTGCATARLRACSSRRSTLNSSARTGSPLSHGDGDDSRRTRRSMSDDNSAFPRRLQRELAAYVESRRPREMVTSFDGYQHSLARIGSDDHKGRVHKTPVHRQRAAIPSTRSVPGNATRSR